MSSPGWTQRKVTTTIELADGQTFAIAEAAEQTPVTASKDVTPVLGDLPVVGALFRSVATSGRRPELWCWSQPRLAAPMNPGEVPAVPGEAWRHPPSATCCSRATSRPGSAQAPRFYGKQGFNAGGDGSSEVSGETTMLIQLNAVIVDGARRTTGRRCPNFLRTTR